jgi:hypothetical protein
MSTGSIVLGMETGALGFAFGIGGGFRTAAAAKDADGKNNEAHRHASSARFGAADAGDRFGMYFNQTLLMQCSLAMRIDGQAVMGTKLRRWYYLRCEMYVPTSSDSVLPLATVGARQYGPG